MESFNIESQELKDSWKKKRESLGLGKSESIREALTMWINYHDDYAVAEEHFKNAELNINKFKYTLNDYCTKNKELNYWLIPDDSKGLRCTKITCQNETCLSNAVMINVLRKHLKDDKGQWKDQKIYNAFSQKHYENMKLPGTIQDQDEEYINIIESWLLDLMGRYNIRV